MKYRPSFHTILFAVLAALSVPQLSAAEPREHLLLDSNWKFHLGDDWPEAARWDQVLRSTGPIEQRFNDQSWPSIDLPQDWAMSLPYDRSSSANIGFRTLGLKFPKTSVAWYRRSFELPQSDSGKRIWLTFDGVMHDAAVWVNGWFVEQHAGGYYPFRADITDIVRFGGANLIAVRVDATRYEGWFYEGAGIYRHVWLEKTAPVAIAPDGIFVYPSFENNVVSGSANIHVEATLLNTRTNTAAATVTCEVVSPDGKLLARFGQPATVADGSQQSVKLQTKVSSPALWSPESPKLYKLITAVSVGDETVDRQETAFGIRTVGFDPTNGFLLNGQHYELLGVCIHQDWAGVGAAVPDSLQYFRVRKLKEMGCNAIRTAHNPYSTGFYEACDQLGMLVMDESRRFGSDPENLHEWTVQIQRDRNHPSVAMWCVGNEERGAENSPQGANAALTMQNLAKKLDPTRAVTYAAPNGNSFRGINAVIEVRGWNYFVFNGANAIPDEAQLKPPINADVYHAAHPTQPNLATEQGSIVATRGIYASDRQRCYITAYDDNWTGWNVKARTMWPFFAARPYMSGLFIWTGFDYGGEPSPFGWPAINSQYGILDRCGFPKDSFYYYQSWWQTNTVLHLLPHWNWPGKEGQDIRVDAYSNCRSVELFLNGTSLGRQTMKPNSALNWQVKYAPGSLSAKGFDDAGKVIAETKVETTGDAAQIQLTPDRKTINADAEDVCVFTISALDAQGRAVPTSQNKINFALEGKGRIIGVGNGDPTCHEPDSFAAGASPQWARSLFNGLAQVIVQSTREAGEIKLTATADGLGPATVTVQTQAGMSHGFLP